MPEAQENQGPSRSPNTDGHGRQRQIRMRRHSAQVATSDERRLIADERFGCMRSDAIRDGSRGNRRAVLAAKPARQSNQLPVAGGSRKPGSGAFQVARRKAPPAPERAGACGKPGYSVGEHRHPGPSSSPRSLIPLGFFQAHILKNGCDAGAQDVRGIATQQVLGVSHLAAIHGRRDCASQACR